VLSGYGSAETASLFTGNLPNDRRLGSAGRPLSAGEVRISHPNDQGIGEIELRGGSITRGYLNNPEANQAAFTPDGWFRTGDLGFIALMVSCSSLGGQRKSWCWAVGKR
jgi:long-chain acyl-CoA synthetase